MLSANSHNFARLLSEQLPLWTKKERSWFDDEASGREDRVVIHGFGDIGRKILWGLRSLKIEPLAIIDAKLSQSMKEVEGVPCVSPAEGAARWGEAAIFVVAVFNQTKERSFASIRNELQSLGAQKVIYFLPLFWKYAEIFLPHYSIDLPSKMASQTPRIQEAFALLGDDQSREDFAFFIESIISPNPERTRAATWPAQTYFPEDLFRLTDQETFIDCGAYDGDTLLKFHQLTQGKYTAYVGVEPDPANFTKLKSRIANLESSTEGVTEAQGVGVGRQRQTLAFDSQGTISSAIGQGGDLSIPVETLETILAGRIPTYVKMDIEGFEMEALQGGEALLRQTHPRLAVCIYHVQNHPWELALYIHSLNARYRIYVRRHREYLDDVIMYAIAE